MSRRPYNYTILRYVHDIVTGEFVNVGIVFIAPAHGGEPARLLFKFKERIQRLRPMFPDIDRAAFVSAMRAVKRSASAKAKQIESDRMFASGDAKAIAAQILPRDGSSLQWSEPGTGIARDLRKEFDRISERMLSIYDRRNDNRRSDEEVWRPVRQALQERHVQIELEPSVITGNVDSIEFQYAWKNGQIHAYEPLSFDLSDAANIRDKARKWRGNLDAAADGASQQFKAYFIAGKPSDPRLIDAYHTALQILRQAASSPEVYEETEIDQLVSKIEADVRSHKHGSLGRTH